MPISKRLFWISCFPSIMMLSWMQSSIRQPPGAHCGQTESRVSPQALGEDRDWTDRERVAQPGGRLLSSYTVNPNPWNLRVGPCLEKGSLQMQLVK
jgi:hypothetical protein